MDAYLGEIKIFAGQFAPNGWALCNGQSLQISGNEALFSLIGATYGGDGRTTFALPDLRNRLPLGSGQSAVSGTTYTKGQTGGTTTVTLNADQLPAHTHVMYATTANGSTNAPAGNLFAASSAANTVCYANRNAPNQTLQPLDEDIITPYGGTSSGATPHDNRMSSLSLTFIICLDGIYPTQS